MSSITKSTHVIARNTNQALALAHYARDFMANGKPSDRVLKRTTLFHTDSVLCGISALALRTNAPTVLRQEALDLYKDFKVTSRTNFDFKTRLFGIDAYSNDVKAITANCAAVREWDSNGTVFGYREEDPSLQAGEFGHNDFYPVVMAAVERNESIDGATALKAMVLLDEIRGRLAESFSLKTYKIDHVVHGAIASIVTYGTLLQATPEQIESAIGMFVAHYIPFRAIRAGHQLSDSKGASAALSTEVALMSLHRSMKGFVGPKDIFRNPQAIFKLFGKSEADESPFDIHVGFEGEDFSVIGMHFKLGLYEHQSAGAIQGVIDILSKGDILNSATIEDLKSVEIEIYEPAFGIIGDPHKRNPTTRQSADHSMVYIIASVIKKAFEKASEIKDTTNKSELWKHLILTPEDYSPSAINHPTVRRVMELIQFKHGGPLFDAQYPKGIPTSLSLNIGDTKHQSSMVMYPAGHAKCSKFDMKGILQNKFNILAGLALQPDDVPTVINKLNRLGSSTNASAAKLYKIPIQYADKSIDDL